MKLLWDSLARSADSSPDKPALVEEGLALTYADLLHVTAAMAAFLRRQGLRPADTVAIQVPHSVDWVVSLFGVMRVGARVLVLDGGLKPQEVADSCAKAGASLLLTGQGGQDVPLRGGARRLPVPTARALRAEAPLSGGVEGTGAQTGFLILSSGTTGPPKLVHRPGPAMEATARLNLARLGYGPDDRTLAVLPFCHAFGLGNVLLASMAGGGTLVVAPFSPRQTTAMVEKERITVLLATPFMFRMLAETAFQRRPDFSSVRLAASVGSALSPAIAAGFKESFGVGIWQSYGATEAGPVALGCPEEGQVAGCVGKPFTGVEVLIRDAEGRPLGPGQSGEIVVRSACSSCCYLGDPEASAGKFQDGYVLTGDIGHLDEAGRLFVTGRAKPMVNVGGKKVSPSEVETCLRSHPRVAEALVVAGKGAEGTEWVKALVSTARKGDGHRVARALRGTAGRLQGAAGDRVHGRLLGRCAAEAGRSATGPPMRTATLDGVPIGDPLQPVRIPFPAAAFSLSRVALYRSLPLDWAMALAVATSRLDLARRPDRCKRLLSALESVVGRSSRRAHGAQAGRARPRRARNRHAHATRRVFHRPGQWLLRSLRPQGLEHLAAAKASGRGAIIMGTHAGPTGWVGAILQQLGYPLRTHRAEQCDTGHVSAAASRGR